MLATRARCFLALIEIKVSTAVWAKISSTAGGTQMSDDREADGLITDVISSWRNWREKRKQQNELGELTSQDVIEIAADAGVSPTELIDAVRLGPHSADELVQLLEALEINDVLLEHSGRDSLNDMKRLCSECASKKRCRRALANGIASMTYEAFCPNAEALHDLEQMQRMIQPFPGR
jgi:hypothetical protein